MPAFTPVRTDALASSASTGIAIRSAGASPRLAALDWTKGVLIVFMVVYHGINYSVFRPVAFQFLAFLPPSFILLAGFVVGNIYASKYDLRDWAPYGRLLVRGFKILLLFTVANVLLHIYEYRRFGLTEGVLEFLTNSQTVFLIGNGRVAVFEVLLPIAYFLFAAPILMGLKRFSRWWPILIAAGTFALCLWLQNRGLLFEHLQLFSAGIIGVALGAIPLERINQLASRWWLILLAYAAYRVLSHLYGESYAIQNLGACTTLLLIYALALRASSGTIGAAMVRVGQYSLFAYLVQIALLQVLLRTTTTRQPDQWWQVALFILAALTGTLLLVEVARRLRDRWTPADAAYKVVFA